MDDDGSSKLWRTNDGIYFGFQVDPIRAPAGHSILDEPWQHSDRQIVYPGRPDDAGDQHIVTIGPNGSGKTRRLLIPNLCRLLGWSMVVVDVKGRLAALTAALRASVAGHEVRVIDPFGVMEKNYPDLVAKHPFLRSTGYNPLASLDPDDDEFPDDTLGTAEGIIRVQGQDPHWSISAQEIVAGAVMYARLTDGPNASLVTVRRWLGQTSEELRATLVEAELASKDFDCEELATRVARFQELNGENKELNGIVSTALAQTRWLDSRPIKRDISRGSFDFGVLKQRPVTIYLVLPPRHLAKHSTWLRVMITSIVTPLMRSVEPAKVPVLLMLDEFAQLGHLPVIEDNMAMMREYGIKLWTVFQDLAQAKDIYKRWESFIGNAGVVQAFAPQDVTTREYLSKLSGQRFYWITTGSTNEGLSVGAQHSQQLGAAESTHYMAGPNYWPQGLAAMGKGHAVLFAGGRKARTWLPDPSAKDDPLGIKEKLLF